MLFNNRFTKTAVLFVGVCSLLLIQSCSSGESVKPTDAADGTLHKKDANPLVSNGGADITFDVSDSSHRLLKFDSAQFRDVSVTTTAPARIVLSAASIEDGSLLIPVFESSDLTQLFTDYTKTLNDQSSAKRELERLQDLLVHKAVAGKDVIQAESNLRAIDVAIMGYESRLLQAGLAPNDLRSLHANTSLMIANVPESEIWTVQKGEDVQIEFDAYKGEILHGRVIDIGKALDPATRTMNVRISIVDTKHALRPGMFAKASFGTDTVHKFVIPTSSVISVEGKSFVFVRSSERTYHRREVALGTQVGDSYIVLSGLTNGEYVVTSGSYLLKGLSFGS